jgi:hypothetical protein
MTPFFPRVNDSPDKFLTPRVCDIVFFVTLPLQIREEKIIRIKDGMELKGRKKSIA